MERRDVMEIAEGLRMIEEGVEKIQRVMRDKKIKSIQDMAAELIPIFESHDNELSRDVIKRLG